MRTYNLGKIYVQWWLLHDIIISCTVVKQYHLKRRQNQLPEAKRIHLVVLSIVFKRHVSIIQQREISICWIQKKKMSKPSAHDKNCMLSQYKVKLVISGNKQHSSDFNRNGENSYTFTASQELPFLTETLLAPTPDYRKYNHQY